MAFSKPYREGQKVCREIDINDESKGQRYGRIARVYTSFDRTDRRFRYNEMYAVLWNDGETTGGFLRHGLTPLETEAAPA